MPGCTRCHQGWNYEQSEMGHYSRWRCLWCNTQEKAVTTKNMTGVDLIEAERLRQIDVEGWTFEHDDQHDGCEMTYAAVCYANYALKRIESGKHYGFQPKLWPWDSKWWKPDLDPIRNLVKAGALIAAEIDRLQRLPEATR